MIWLSVKYPTRKFARRWTIAGLRIRSLVLFQLAAVDFTFYTSPSQGPRGLERRLEWTCEWTKLCCCLLPYGLLLCHVFVHSEGKSSFGIKTLLLLSVIDYFWSFILFSFRKFIKFFSFVSVLSYMLGSVIVCPMGSCLIPVCLVKVWWYSAFFFLCCILLYGRNIMFYGHLSQLSCLA